MQQNTISCLHLSRLIIVHSISFKQEASDSPHNHHHPRSHLHNSGPSSAPFQWWQALIFYPISILRHRDSVWAPSTRWSSDKWRQSLISFPIPFLSTAVTINFTCTQWGKKAAGQREFTHFWILLLIECVCGGGLFCLITFTLAHTTWTTSLIWRHKPLSILRCVFQTDTLDGGSKLCVYQLPLWF